MKLLYATADYNQQYNPSTCNNGGGYWQPYGTLVVKLDSGETLFIEYDDTSCGDFGERWSTVIHHNDTEYIFCENDISSYCNYDNDADNDNNWHAMMNDLCVDANDIIKYVSSIIHERAWDKYYLRNQ